MLCALWLASAMAQNSPTPAEKSAMERAQREADGPRRRILEAAKVKGTVKAAEPANAAPAVPVSAPPPVAPAATVAAKPVVKEEPVPERVLVTQPAAMEPVAMPASAVSGVPTMSQVKLAPASVSMIPLPTPPVALEPPQLVSKVEPDLPTRLLRRIGTRRVELLVDMTIQPDGSVTEVAVREPVEDDLAAPVRDAVSQWRYEPQPVVRQHTVRLVFGQS